MSLESVFKLSLIMNMVDNMSGPAASAMSNLESSMSRIDGMTQTFGNMTKSGTIMQEVGSQITEAVMAPAEATFETRRALGDLASLGVEDLESIESAARSFSDQWAGTTKADFIAASYSIKSGISSLSDEGVAEFTSMAALTGKATKSTVDEMTSLFATGYAIYKDYYGELSDMEFADMFSGGISKAVQQFKTSGTGMAQGIQNLGASATNANVPLEEQLAILGMLQGTMGGSEAGTKYKAFLRSAVKGGEALELSFTDANNQLLSLPEILEQLQGKFGDTIDAAEKMEIQQAFGDSESVAFIDLLYNKVGDLTSNIDVMGEALADGSSVTTEMAEAMNAFEPDQFEVGEQMAQNLTESIGSQLLPTLSELQNKKIELLQKVSAWVENNQELTGTILKIVLAVGIFLSVGGSLVAVIGGIGMVCTKAYKGFKVLKTGFMLAKTSLVPLISSVWSFTAALLANPITWIVIGVVALIAAIVLLYNKCEWFRDAVDKILGFFKEKLGAAWEVAKQVFTAIGDVIGNVMGAAKEFVSEKLGAMKTAFEEHGGGIKGVAAAAMTGVKGIFTSGFNALDNLTGGKLSSIRDKFSEKLAPVKKITGKVMQAAKDTASQNLDSMKAAFEEHGGGIQGAAAAAMTGVKGRFTAGYTFLDNLTDGKLTSIKNKFSEKLAPIKEITGNVMQAAKDTASEKLGNMKSAFEEHGGGIQGVAAAAMEGVKGHFTTGFTFLDNLTDGKLSGIKDKFFENVTAIKDGIGEKVMAIGDAFGQGLELIKTKITDTIEWFRESGRRVVTTFAEGISSAWDSAVEAVQGGLQKVRNFLPFSDAKEGPLSTLTLSGQRTMTTYAEGLMLEQNAPAEAMERGLEQTKMVLERPPVQTGRPPKQEEFTDADKETAKEGTSKDGTNIAHLEIKVDFSKIEDLPKLMNLLKEIQDYTSASGGSDDSPTVPAPA